MERSEKHILQNPSDTVDDSRDQLQDLPEEDPEEESGEEPEEDLEEESGEELEDDPEEESGEELEKDSEEESGVELEEYPEMESGEEPEEDPEEDPEIDNKWGEASSNGVPSFSQASLYQSLKKCKPEGMQSQTLESEPARLELSNTVISVATTDKFGSKDEGSGTSGKRRRSRWEPHPDGDGIKEDDQTCKRKKTRWSSEESQMKMLGPLQLPDFAEDFVIGSDKDPQIQGLEAELLEINRKLRSPLIDDRPAEERSPSPDPIYDELGIRINTREVRLRRKLVQKRRSIISKLIKLNPTFNPPPDYMPQKFVKKLYIPTKEYSEYNFVGLIIGPRGNTQKRMEKETGAKILLRGKGSSKTSSRPASEKDDLHVRIEANDEESLDAAVAMVEKLLIPIEEGRNEHKRTQLKELAELNGAHRNDNVCSVCGDHGHRYYACPNLQSTFKMDSFYPGCSNSLSTPRPGKEISDKHLYVGYLPQSIDDNRLC